MTYYNTTYISLDDLKKEITNAKYQEDKIMIFFKGRPNIGYTPFDILKMVFSGSTPITSVRRAMTNLTTDNKLIKTNNQRQGEYGKPCYTWKLNKE